MRNMSNSPELVDDFALACDEMVGSKLLLAESKISNILRTVASSTILFRLFGDVLYEFDFETELAGCTHSSEFGGKCLKMPLDRKLHIAIVLTLLVEFDSKRRDLLGFLSEYYATNSDIGESYALFVHSVIPAFKNNVLTLLKAENAEDEFADSTATDSAGTNTAVGDQATVLSKRLGEELVQEANKLIAETAKNSSLTIIEREDVLILCEGLANASASKNAGALRICLVGLKNTLSHKRLSSLEKSAKNIFQLSEELLDIIG